MSDTRSMRECPESGAESCFMCDQSKTAHVGLTAEKGGKRKRVILCESCFNEMLSNRSIRLFVKTSLPADWREFLNE